MRTTAAVAAQLRLLHDDPDRGDDLAAALGRLGRDVVLAVPSCLAVTIRLTRLGTEVSVTATTRPAAVLASLAVPLSAGGLVILRAAEPGAFVLLADDLDGLLGPVEVDRHLTWPGGERGGSVADLRAVDRAVGVLVDRGLPPDEAHQELRRRAGAAATGVAAASRELLASLPARPGAS